LRGAIGEAISHLPAPRPVKTFTVRLGRHTEAYKRYLFWWDFFRPEERARILTDTDATEQVFAEALNPYLAAPYDDDRTFDAFTARMTLADLSLWIADLSNMLVDKMSMLASLEVRAPFLDYELVEFIQTIPFHLRLKPKLKGWWLGSKYIFRKTFGDMLPREILERPKWGFLGPASGWLRTELRTLVLDLLSPATLRKNNFFDPTCVNNLLQGHLDGTAYNLQKVWTLLVFQLWHEIYIEQNPTYVPA
jgi:asparagine synthase (glutamine-hydrolysing)